MLVLSEPLGATVAIDIYGPNGKSREWTAKTPSSIMVLEGSNLRAEFTLKGHEDQTVKVVAKGGAKLQAKLVAKPAPRPRVASKRRPSPKPKPVAAPPPKPVAAPPPPKPKKPGRVPIDDLK